MQVQNAPAPIVIAAPLSGELVPLEKVPDPVFSQRMVGDGIAIDPLDSVLRSPCEGVVAQLHPAGHAVTIQRTDGTEILMHIGLDTVELKGQGFSPKVKQGQKVSLGAPLIEFDLDFVATHAKSVLTLVVVSTPERVASLKPASGMVRSGQDTIFTFTAKEPGDLPTGTTGQQRTSEAIVIPNATGLHARPAAVLASAAKSFQSDIRLRLGEKEANAKSLTSIMAIDAREGATVFIVAQGADGAEAIARLSEMIRRGLGDEDNRPSPAATGVAQAKKVSPAALTPADDPDLLRGVAASPGLGVGTVFQVRHQQIEVIENADHPEDERSRLDGAIEKAKGQLDALESQLRA